MIIRGIGRDIIHEDANVSVLKKWTLKSVLVGMETECAHSEETTSLKGSNSLVKGHDSCKDTSCGPCQQDVNGGSSQLHNSPQNGAGN